MNRAARKLSPIVLAAAAALAFAACNGAKGGNSAGDVAAVVNGKNITLGEVERVIREQTGGQQSQLSPLELGAARLQVLDSLIRDEVLFQRAEKEKTLPNDDEITKVINDQKQQAGSQEAFQKALKDAGQTEESLRELVRKRLAMQKLLDKIGNRADAPSDREIEDFYNNNRQRYVNARGVELSVIYVDPQPNPGANNDAQSDDAAQSKAKFIQQRLKSGGDFATVARESSEDPQTALRGGDIGFFSEEDLKRAGFPGDLVSRFFGSMQPGDTTDPVRGPDGRWSIWKLTNKRLQAENLTLDNPQVRQDAANLIVSQRRQILNAALLEVAMREAKIENKLAESMLNSAASLSSLRPAGAATPAASPDATNAASPAATTAASPAAANSPASNANSK
ncbi:MAG TPA: SurA N-terminal domain-containing protein [Pyrinomonadaceae bacterium]|nr:SurA N-terminal domain-containing protein [Pyrinomonadaceae bacterium]